jgi:hypothetical protein
MLEATSHYHEDQGSKRGRERVVERAIYEYIAGRRFNRH